MAEPAVHEQRAPRATVRRELRGGVEGAPLWRRTRHLQRARLPLGATDLSALLAHVLDPLVDVAEGSAVRDVVPARRSAGEPAITDGGR